METRTDGTSPDAVDAQRALQTADSEMKKTQNPRLPLWLNLASAALCFASAGFLMTDPEPTTASIVIMSTFGLVSLVIIALLMRYIWFPRGYRHVKIEWKVVGTIVIGAIFATLIGFVWVIAARDAGVRVSAIWLFIIGGVCLLPAVLDVAERLWPKGTGRHVA